MQMGLGCRFLQLYDLHSQSVAQWTEIEALAKKQDDAALRTVLSALDTQYESMPRMVFCDNVIVNAVLAQRLCRMEQDSIRFAHQLRIPEQIGIQDIDLMCLFSNIMDNAIEACEELPENLQRWIRLQATLRSGLLLLTCENSAQYIIRARSKTGSRTRVGVDGSPYASGENSP